MDYAICEIKGRQYLVKAGQVVEVDKLEGNGRVGIDKVLLKVQGDKVEIGQPYLKEVIEFEILGQVRKPKVRVAKFHAKANYRKVSGSRREVTQIKLAENQKKAVKKS